MTNGLIRLTLKAKKVLLSFTDQETIESSDLVAAISEMGGMGEDLSKSLELNYASLKQKVSPEQLIKSAFYEALRLKQPYVGTEHLLLAVLSLNEFPRYKEAQEHLAQISIFPQMFSEPLPGSKFKVLEPFATNLNLRVALDPQEDYVERDAFELMLSTLLQQENSNPLIVGDSGVGKRSLVRLLAAKLNNMDVPANLLGYQIYEVDLFSFITSNNNKGNLEASLAAFFAELSKLRRVILYIKNFENLFFVTNVGMAVPIVYNAFKSYLDDNGIKYMATLSSEVYSRLETENSQILSNFSVLNLEEPDEESIRKIMAIKAKVLGEMHGVKFDQTLLDYVYNKAKNLPVDEKFPQRAVELMDQAAAKLLLRRKKVPDEYRTLFDESLTLARGLEKSVEEGDYDHALEIKKLISSIEAQMFKNEQKMFGRRKYAVRQKDVERALEDYAGETKPAFEQDISSLGDLEARIKKKIIGQDDAVEAVSRALLRSRLGLRSKKRPLGNFLFLGPTGVGKTELAKVLSSEFFGEDHLIRLDMSDFGEKHTVARLVGAPPGYVGYGEGGELTSKIEKNPSSLVLFDEIEKAHPDVLNILLQIMEEGELVDAKGTTFDFSSAVVVLTSNLGTEIVHQPGIGFEAKVLNDSSLEKRLKSNLKKILKPELLNRLDEIVVFNRLKCSDQYQILDLLLEEVRANLDAQEVSIRISHKVKDFLLQKGYSKEYGARALRRTVEREFLDRIAEVLLEHKERPLKLSALGRKDKIKVKILS